MWGSWVGYGQLMAGILVHFSGLQVYPLNVIRPQARVTEVESYKALLSESRKETSDTKGMLEVTNLRLATMARDGQTRLNEELNRAALQHVMLEKEMEVEIARLKKEMAEMQATWQAEKVTHALVKQDRDRLIAGQEGGPHSPNGEGRPLGYRRDSQLRSEGEGPSGENNADRIMVRKLEHLLHRTKEEAEEKAAEHERQLEEMREANLATQLLLSRAKEKLGRHWQSVVDGAEAQRRNSAMQAAASSVGHDSDSDSDVDGPDVRYGDKETDHDTCIYIACIQ
jgi:hypothetical protein